VVERILRDEMTFYDTLEPAKSLDAALDPMRYVGAPPDWHLAITDIEHSSAAIASGRHKTVNMIAAACIAAARNVCVGSEIPFAFGGDGATLLIPPAFATSVATALAGVRTTARAEGLMLRLGMMTVGALRDLGQEVLVARYEAAPGIIFAMFRGGGVGFLERVLKDREPTVPASLVSVDTEGSPPDLTGLSCRFEPIASRGGCTVSLVIAMLEADEDYRPVLSKILEIAGDDARPTSLKTLAAAFKRSLLPNSASIDLELDALQVSGALRRLRKRFEIVCGWLLGQLSVRFGLRLGPRNLMRELEEKVRNTDFAKADGALQMVIDCTPDQLAQIETYLAERERNGLLVYGIHVANTALMTCLVDSMTEDWHVHFIDGAGGGYTHAATLMKDKLAERLV